MTNRKRIIVNVIWRHLMNRRAIIYIIYVLFIMTLIGCSNQNDENIIVDVQTETDVKTDVDVKTDIDVKTDVDVKTDIDVKTGNNLKSDTEPIADAELTQEPMVEKENHNSPIIGIWRSGDKSNPLYIGMIDSNVEFIFNPDGSYSQIVLASINYIYYCTAYKGSFKVSDNEITITDCLKSDFGIQEYDWDEAHTTAASSEYTSYDDTTLPLIITDKDNISINTIELFRVD